MPDDAPPLTDMTGPRDAAAEQALLERVGLRVRQARTARRLPRRALSEMSGVSPRYLAQLESGTGNISLTLLSRVAGALGVPIQTLFAAPSGAEGAPEPLPEAARVAAGFAAADPETQDAIRALLARGADPAARAGRICLVGLRGAGKSTLGRRLALELGVPFVELKDEIERLGGMAVGEIMALYGPDGYRALEGRALDAVIAAHDRLVLAVAGGIVSDSDSFDTLLARCHTIWLRATPEEHMARVRAQGDERPMAGNPEAMTQLRAILARRAAIYGRARAQVDTSGLGVDEALARLCSVVRQGGFVLPPDAGG